MHRRIAVWTAVAATALGGCAAAGGDSGPSLESGQARESYSLGHMVGSQLRDGMSDVDTDAFAAGISDALESGSRLGSGDHAMALAGRQGRQAEVVEAPRAG